YARATAPARRERRFVKRSRPGRYHGRRMKPLVTAALLAMSLMSVRPVSADVIELRTGERVEGTFRGADDSAVRIEIDGRPVTFAPSQVRAIYYGSAPSMRAPAELQERDAA